MTSTLDTLAITLGSVRFRQAQKGGLAVQSAGIHAKNHTDGRQNFVTRTSATVPDSPLHWLMSPVALLLWSPLLVFAQLAQPGGPAEQPSAGVNRIALGRSLNLDEALVVAARRHPTVAAKRQESEASGQSLKTARWQRFPTLTFSTSSQQGTGAVSTLRLEQPIWTGGKLSADIEASEARLSGAEFAVQEVLQTVLVDVSKNFVDTLRFGERVAAAAQSVAEHERLLALIERRAENQVSPLSDVVSARARLYQAQSDLLNLRNNLENARSALNLAVGESGFGLDAPNTKALRWEPTQDEVIDSALNYAPKLRRMASERQQLEAEMRSRAAAIYPQISFRRDEHIPNGETASAGNEVKTYVALNFQTGAGLSYQSSVAEAVSKIKASEFSREALQRDIRDAMRADWNEWQVSAQGSAVLEQLASSTQDVYDSFLRQFSAGRKTWQDVLNARREATQARHSLSDTRWAGFLAGIRMEIATGRLTQLQQPSDAPRKDPPADSYEKSKRTE